MVVVDLEVVEHASAEMIDLHCSGGLDHLVAYKKAEDDRTEELEAGQSPFPKCSAVVAHVKVMPKDAAAGVRAEGVKAAEAERV